MRFLIEEDYTPAIAEDRFLKRVLLDFEDIREVVDFIDYNELLLATEPQLRKLGMKMLAWYEKHSGYTLEEFNQFHLKYGKLVTLSEIITQKKHSRNWLRAALKEFDKRTVFDLSPSVFLKVEL